MLGSLLIWVKLARRFFHPIKPIVAVQFLGYDAKVTFESEAHRRVLNSDGIELSTLPELRKAHEDFYSLLFAEESVNLETQNHLLSFFSRRLSDHDRDVCEGALLPDEATEVVGLSNHIKAPGPDGLSAGFYLTFWLRLGPLLVEVFNEGLHASQLCDSMKTSITCLVYKKDDRRNLKNWRSISLLNFDYKICSKAISLRLSKVLDFIVDPDQTCSVPGRSTASNLLLLHDVLDHIERSGETGILVSSDQEKAFDRVDLAFLLNLLRHLSFGPSLPCTMELKCG